MIPKTRKSEPQRSMAMMLDNCRKLSVETLLRNVINCIAQ